jgi:hypothetical protein
MIKPRRPMVHVKQIVAQFFKNVEAKLNPRTGSRLLDFPGLVTTNSDSHNPQYRKIYYTTFLQSYGSFKRLFCTLFFNNHACVQYSTVQYILLSLNCNCISSVCIAHVGRPSVGQKTLISKGGGQAHFSHKEMAPCTRLHTHIHAYTQPVEKALILLL